MKYLIFLSNLATLMIFLCAASCSDNKSENRNEGIKDVDVKISIDPRTGYKMNCIYRIGDGSEKRDVFWYQIGYSGIDSKKANRNPPESVSTLYPNARIWTSMKKDVVFEFIGSASSDGGRWWSGKLNGYEVTGYNLNRRHYVFGNFEDAIELECWGQGFEHGEF